MISYIGYLTVLIEEAKEAIQKKLSLTDFISTTMVAKEYVDRKGINGVKRNLKTVFEFYSANNL